MQKGKIVLVPFPFDDLSDIKVRPAVILTEPIGEYKHVVLAFISSQVPANPFDSDIIIDAQDPDFGETGLRVSSVLRLHRLLSVTVDLVQRELGILAPSFADQTEQKLKTLFGLA